MPKKTLFGFGLGVAVLTAVLLYFLGGGQKAIVGKNRTVYDNWEDSYLPEESQAYGISLFNELLEYRTKKKSKLVEYELDSIALAENKSTYMFVGEKFQLKNNEFDSIINRVKKGANLFLAYKEISTNIYDYFFNESGFLWHYSQYINVNADTTYRICSVFQDDTIAIAWNLFSFDRFRIGENNDFGNLTSLSSIQKYSNFADIEIGNGHVYLHSNPELFQNYQLLSKNGFNYSQFVVSHIPESHQIKWLEIGRFDEKYSLFEKDGEGERDTSFLQLIFQNKALTFALLIALFGLILFIIFRTKRTKPIIPYVAPSVNQSLNFAETIKEIYYKQQTPYSILQVMRKNFLIAVNKQFFVDISKGEKEIKVLAEKANIEEKQIRYLLDRFETKEPTSVDYSYLEEVSGLQQQFYAKSGIIKSRVKEKSALKTKRFNRKIGLSVFIILLGISSILYGFYLLHRAEGFGISLWPLGILITILGARLYGLPVLKINENQLTFYPILGKKQKITVDLIHQIRIEGNKIIFETHDQKTFIIPNQVISKYDKKTFEQYIYTLQNKLR